MEFQYGTIVPRIPDEFTPPEVWPEYGHVGDPVSLCAREMLSENPVTIRWSLWPLTFEQHWGDTEPDVTQYSHGQLARNRIAYWRPLHQVESTPPGWHLSREKIFRIDGYQKLETVDFVKRWNKKARRDLRLWQEKFSNKTHRIEIVSFEEYSAAYRESLVAKHAGADRLQLMKRKLQVPRAKEAIRIVGVRNMETGEIIAGTGIVFSPTFKSSTHLVPFIKEEGRRTYAATALVHYWFEESYRLGLPHVLTTNFWHPGKPKSWKGFSLFKSHFGWNYITYPPALWRFVGGKLF